jgi:hypothetical protein
VLCLLAQRLGRVLPSSPHYPRSRVALADIHLKQRKDRAAYIQCYLDLLVGGAGLTEGKERDTGRKGGGGAGRGERLVGCVCEGAWPAFSATWTYWWAGQGQGDMDKGVTRGVGRVTRGGVEESSGEEELRVALETTAAAPWVWLPLPAVRPLLSIKPHALVSLLTPPLPPALPNRSSALALTRTACWARRCWPSRSRRRRWRPLKQRWSSTPRTRRWR